MVAFQRDMEMSSGSASPYEQDSDPRPFSPISSSSSSLKLRGRAIVSFRDKMEAVLQRRIRHLEREVERLRGELAHLRGSAAVTAPGPAEATRPTSATSDATPAAPRATPLVLRDNPSVVASLQRRLDRAVRLKERLKVHYVATLRRIAAEVRARFGATISQGSGAEWRMFVSDPSA